MRGKMGWGGGLDAVDVVVLCSVVLRCAACAGINPKPREMNDCLI